MNAAIATNYPRLPSLGAHGTRQMSPAPPALMVGGLRAHVWLEARNFFTRESAQQFCWLWLLGADGRVHALRVPSTRLGDDHFA